MDPTVRDTTDEARAAQVEAWRRLGPSGRLELALRLSDDVREIAVSGEVARRSDGDRRLALVAVLRRQWGDELHSAVFDARASR